jgi:predicted acyl esterase
VSNIIPVTLRLIPCLFLLHGTAVFAAQEPLDLQGVREEHIMIPMRDGIHLSAYVYFPQ